MAFSVPLETPSTRRRFMSKVRVLPNGCWEWSGTLTSYGTGAGYGLFWLEGKNRPAHRVSWSWANGPIPDGAVLDHTCHSDSECSEGTSCLHRRCVNPDHLRPTSTRENLLAGRTRAAKNAAKTHCPQGHPYDDENTGTYRKGGSIIRRCRTCNREYARRKRMQKTSEAR